MVSKFCNKIHDYSEKVKFCERLETFSFTYVVLQTYVYTGL